MIFKAVQHERDLEAAKARPATNGMVSKYALLTWLALRNRLTTGARIRDYIVCGRHEETLQHPFFCMSIFSSNLGDLDVEISQCGLLNRVGSLGAASSRLKL
ncbi:unnamed protein product [Arabis nemorensis]|uniref:Uncharacterized protein n=1 Tax=Arabis nemorensis TaxID=586526 RepID=A0A565BVE1_9BRAS|nr:unnamed protein product [Arabis nemorensis]